MIWLLTVVLVSAAVLSAVGKVLGTDFPFLVWLAVRGRKPSPYQSEERERATARHQAAGA